MILSCCAPPLFPAGSPAIRQPLSSLNFIEDSGWRMAGEPAGKSGGAQQLKIIYDGGANRGILNLYGDVFSALCDRAMDLAEGRRREGFGVKFAEDVLRIFAEGGLELGAGQ